MITLLIALVPHFSHATDLDRRSLLRGVGGIIATPRLPQAHVAPFASAAASAPAALKLNWLTFPNSIEEMARCWRWVNAKTTYFREHLDFNLVDLVRHLHRHPGSSGDLGVAWGDYLALVDRSDLTDAYLNDHSALSVMRNAERRLAEAGRAALLRVDETCGAQVAAELLEMEDRIMADFGLTAEDYFHAVALFKQPYRVYFLDDPAAARRLRFDDDFVRRVFNDLHQISPVLAADLSQRSVRQNMYEGLFRALKIVNRANKSSVLSFDLVPEDDGTPWYLLRDGESVEDRAALYVDVLKRLAQKRRIVAEVKLAPLRAQALKMIDFATENLREELETLPARLEFARTWGKDRSDRDPSLGPSGFHPDRRAGIDASWLLKLHSLANAFDFDLDLPGVTVASAPVPAPAAPSELAACDQALLAAPTTIIAPLSPHQAESVGSAMPEAESTADRQ